MNFFEPPFLSKKRKKKGKKKGEEEKSAKLKGAFYRCRVKNVVGKSSFTRNLITRVRRRYLKIPLSRRRRWGSIDVAFWTMFLSRTNERKTSKETQNETKKRTPREATRRSLSAHNHAETHGTVSRRSHRDRACSPVFLFFLPPSFSLFSFRLCNNADSAYNKHVFSLAGKIN